MELCQHTHHAAHICYICYIYSTALLHGAVGQVGRAPLTRFGFRFVRRNYYALDLRSFQLVLALENGCPHTVTAGEGVGVWVSSFSVPAPCWCGAKLQNLWWCSAHIHPFRVFQACALGSRTWRTPIESVTHVVSPSTEIDCSVACKHCASSAACLPRTGSALRQVTCSLVTRSSMPAVSVIHVASPSTEMDCSVACKHCAVCLLRTGSALSTGRSHALWLHVCRCPRGFYSWAAPDPVT